MDLLQKDNGTLSVSLKDVYIEVESNYQTIVYVDWLKNATGKVNFQVTADMDFDFSVDLDSQGKAKATAKSVQGLRIQEDSVNATLADANEGLAASLSVLFAQRGGPVLMVMHDKLQELLDQSLDDALKNVKVETSYALANNYRYKVKNTPTRVGIFQDGQLTVYLQVDLYNYSTKMSSQGGNVSHTAIGNSSASLLEYEVDQNLVEVAVGAYADSLSTSTKKFDNKELGKIVQSYYGDTSYNALYQAFQMDESDYLKKDNEYEVGVRLVKDSTAVSFANSTMTFQVEVSLWKPYGYSLKHPRKFVLDCSAVLTPFIDGSLLKASLKKTSASAIRLYGDSDKEMTLTAAQQQQYLTMASLFMQMKKKSLNEMANNLQYDLSRWDPLSKLHASVTGKSYKLTVHETMLNIDVQSDEFPAPQQSAQLFPIYDYYQNTLSFYERTANTLQHGLNAGQDTVVAQVARNGIQYFWLRPQQSLAKMTSFQDSQVSLYKKK